MKRSDNVEIEESTEEANEFVRMKRTDNVETERLDESNNETNE